MSLSKWIKRSVPTAMLAAGFVAFGSTAASAAVIPSPDDLNVNDNEIGRLPSSPTCEELSPEQLDGLCGITRIGDRLPSPTEALQSSVAPELPGQPMDELPALREVIDIRGLLNPSPDDRPRTMPVQTASVTPVDTPKHLPSLPSMPGELPSLPSIPGELPSLPSLSNGLQQHPIHMSGAVTQLPGAAEVPELPGQDELTDMAELPELPGLPGLPGQDELPSLPSLPGLSS